MTTIKGRLLFVLLIGLTVGTYLPDHFVDFELAFRIGTVGLETVNHATTDGRVSMEPDQRIT